MKFKGCWNSCEGWNEDDLGLGCYGWCTIREIPITFNLIYREECAFRKDREPKQNENPKESTFIAGKMCVSKRRN